MKFMKELSNFINEIVIETNSRKGCGASFMKELSNFINEIVIETNSRKSDRIPPVMVTAPLQELECQILNPS